MHGVYSMKLLMVLVYIISVVDNEGHYIRGFLYLMFMSCHVTSLYMNKIVKTRR